MAKRCSVMLRDVVRDRPGGDTRHHGMPMHHATVGMLGHMMRSQSCPYPSCSGVVMQNTCLGRGNERRRSSECYCR